MAVQWRGSLSPEQFSRNADPSQNALVVDYASDEKITTKSDIYSLGCVLLEIFGGAAPWSKRSVKYIVTHAACGVKPPEFDRFRATADSQIAKALVAIIGECLERLPARRPTAQAVVKALGYIGAMFLETTRAEAEAKAATQSAADRVKLLEAHYKKVLKDLELKHEVKAATKISTPAEAEEVEALATLMRKVEKKSAAENYKAAKPVTGAKPAKTNKSHSLEFVPRMLSGACELVRNKSDPFILFLLLETRQAAPAAQRLAISNEQVLRLLISYTSVCSLVSLAKSVL